MHAEPRVSADRQLVARSANVAGHVTWRRPVTPRADVTAPSPTGVRSRPREPNEMDLARARARPGQAQAAKPKLVAGTGPRFWAGTTELSVSCRPHSCK
jgi:hypothetical protein